MEAATAMDDDKSDIPPGERSQPPEAEWSIVLANVGLVHRFINDHCPHRLDRSDLVQEGLLGLLEAARRFDPSRQVQFSTYAYHWIRNRILAALRADNGGWTKQEGDFVPVPVEEAIGDEMQEKLPTLEPPEVEYIRNDLARNLQEHLRDDLDEVERLVIVLRWLSPEQSTLDELARAIGLRSRSSILEVERTALDKLRQAMSRRRRK